MILDKSRLNCNARQNYLNDEVWLEINQKWQINAN